MQFPQQSSTPNIPHFDKYYFDLFIKLIIRKPPLVSIIFSPETLAMILIFRSAFRDWTYG